MEQKFIGNWMVDMSSLNGLDEVMGAYGKNQNILLRFTLYLMLVCSTRYSVVHTIHIGRYRNVSASTGVHGYDVLSVYEYQINKMPNHSHTILN